MNDPLTNNAADDKLLEDYLHRKSALSMGYRRVYVEAPPPELDMAIAARARRALRWLVPGVLAIVIGVGSVGFIAVGSHSLVKQMVLVEKKSKRAEQERLERERAAELVPVIIDPHGASAAQPTREQWLEKIETLKKAGNPAEALAEQKKFEAAYPNSASK